MGRRSLGTMIIALGLAAGATSLSAQSVKVGGQASFADDADFGIGPRVQLALGSLAPGLWLAGSFDYFFPDAGLGGTDGDFDYWELNGNILYEVALADVTNIAPYFGGGINIARTSVPSDGTTASFDDTRVGLNLVGGLSFPLTGFTPFVEARLEVEGGEQFVVAGGILFP